MIHLVHAIGTGDFYFIELGFLPPVDVPDGGGDYFTYEDEEGDDY